MDGDGELNEVDLCPTDNTAELRDQDEDEVGYRCDNCYQTYVFSSHL